MKTSDHLNRGGLYSRKELQDLFQNYDATIKNGIFRPAGHDSVWLFVTEEKKSDRTQYEDRLEGDDLFFAGQIQGRTDPLITNNVVLGLELLLFHRQRTDEHPDYAFCYEGQFEFVSATSGQPTAFHLRRRTPTADGTDKDDVRPTRYWAFACNPNIYDGRSACQQLSEIIWTVPRLDPRIGDRAIIWQTQNSDRLRGVIGLAEVIEGPSTMTESAEEQRFWIGDPSPGPARCCRLRLIEASGLPAWEGAAPELMRSLAVARARGGTIFTLQESQWEAIVKLAGAVAESPGKSADIGQGWMSDPRRRKAVERHAQDTVAKHYSRQGYSIEDVSARSCYDLKCLRGGEVLHVEVKGCTGAGSAVFLTRNEVVHARTNPRTAVLAIVRDIQLTGDGEFITAHGGAMELLHPWTISEDDLTPLQYQYRLP